MTPTPNQRLRDITSFPELIRYLADELEWPIDANNFESYSFDWDAAEDLGVAPEHAAKIREIKQLRPLVSGQPWGVFFIEFEPKKLPVGVLRRLLNKLVTKQRASDNTSDRQTWDLNDLLFISSFGETRDAREIAFAHFHQEEGDLPTLRVLGWDGGDTPLKLDHVDNELHARLHWPDDENDPEIWRTRWSGAFKHRLGHTIQTADMLAKVLAELAKNIRDRCQTLIAAEPDNGPLKKLYKAFQTALIHDLTEEGFADTYAQTITYGLLTAAISRTDMNGGADGTFVQADNITDMVPVTNPFLKEMLQSFLHAGGRKGGLDFDELGVQDVVELLRGDETDLPSVLRDFGNKNPNEDPVIRFYEDFLTAYNKKLKIQRGVFYTPKPVVSYIVRSVHELLQTEFGLEDGLASTVTWGEMIQRQNHRCTPMNTDEKGVDKNICENPSESVVQPLRLPPLTDEEDEKRTISPDEFFVQILDPATGTGTFIVESIDVIHKHLSNKWKTAGAKAMPTFSGFKFPVSSFESWWNAYVPAALLPRLYAYELMMAPYAIAHMKIGLKLHETGYRFKSNERVRVYLTNALEPWQRQLLLPDVEALAHEAAAVNEVKRYKRFTVVIGNPPYSNFGQLNKNPFILGLLEDYKRGLDEKKINLDDDFIKFVRFSQYTLDNAGVGVFGMITNNVFMDGITHRMMRESITKSFQRCWFLNLHGSVAKQEKSPDGTKDENVFDIQQGVGVTLLSKTQNSEKNNTLYLDFWGSREHKYSCLHRETFSGKAWEIISPVSPQFFFVPKDFSGADEYTSSPSLLDCFVVQQNAVKTDRDALFIDFDAAELSERIQRFFGKCYDQEFIERYAIKASSSFDIEARRGRTKFDTKNIKTILYRPFDIRPIYYDQNLTSRPAFKVMRHMIGPQRNLALLAMRQVAAGESYSHFFVTNTLSDNRTFYSNKGILNVFPLMLFDEEFLTEGLNHRPNLSTGFLRKLASFFNLRQQSSHQLPTNLTPEDIFHYAYAVFHSPGYRSRYAEFLKIDFPRLPLTSSLDLFRALARLGGELVALHLLEFDIVEAASSRWPETQSQDGSATYPQLTEYIGENRTVSKVGFTVAEVRDLAPTSRRSATEESIGTVWIDGGGTKSASTSGTSGFRGVSSEVWNFHIGGYQVCEKWLKDRKGRTLTDDDIAHYHKIVVALSNTIRLMAEIDEVIETHGGWPGAFATGLES